MQRGVVTLTGAVRNLIARERAADIGRTVEGVVVVVNEITVQPLLHRSAEDMETAIRHALLANPMTDSFQVTVDVEPNGVVRLSVGAAQEATELAARANVPQPGDESGGADGPTITRCVGHANSIRNASSSRWSRRLIACWMSM